MRSDRSIGAPLIHYMLWTAVYGQLAQTRRKCPKMARDRRGGRGAVGSADTRAGSQRRVAGGHNGGFKPNPPWPETAKICGVQRANGGLRTVRRVF